MWCLPEGVFVDCVHTTLFNLFGCLTLYVGVCFIACVWVALLIVGCDCWFVVTVDSLFGLCCIACARLFACIWLLYCLVVHF